MFFKKKSTKERVCVQSEKTDEKKIKKFSLIPKSRASIGFLSLALAFLVALVLFPLVEKVSYRTVTVAVMTTPVYVGQLISENNFKLSQMSAKNLPKNYIADSSDVVGKYAVMPMLAEEIIVTDKLSSDIPGKNSYLRKLPEGKIAISVSINSFAGGLSGKLREGDIIQIFSVSSDSAEASVDPDLKNITVLAVTNSDAEDLSDNTNADNKIISTITVLVNTNQAKKLAALGTNTTLYAALMQRGTVQTEQSDESIQQGSVENESEDDSVLGQ